LFSVRALAPEAAEQSFPVQQPLSAGNMAPILRQPKPFQNLRNDLFWSRGNVNRHRALRLFQVGQLASQDCFASEVPVPRPQSFRD
jgi:hypothetical protein